MSTVMTAFARFYFRLYITQVSLVLEFSRQNSTLELKLLQFFGVEKV